MSSEGKEFKQGMIAVAIGLGIVALVFIVLWPKEQAQEVAADEQTIQTQKADPDKVYEATSHTEGTPWWLNYDGKYQLYYDGLKITETNRVLVDEDLLVFDPNASRTFLFEDFTLFDDSTLRQAKEFERGAPPLYRVKDGRYWLYVKGQQITDVKTFQSVNDLVVTDNATGVRYRIRDFYILNDNTLRLAQII